MLCVNPLTGTSDGAAPPAANLGTLVPNGDFANATLAAGQVGARCEKGFLMIDGAIPNLGPYVLPGNNYHVYDYALFWGSIRADAERRLAACAVIAPQPPPSSPRPSRSGRLGGLDVGTKTIGLATCDAGWSFATAGRDDPADQVHRRPRSAEARSSRAQRIAGLVVGLPLNLDGSDSPAHPVGPRLRPQPCARSACRSCCGTSAGRPWRSSGR